MFSGCRQTQRHQPFYAPATHREEEAMSEGKILVLLRDVCARLKKSDVNGCVELLAAVIRDTATTTGWTETSVQRRTYGNI